MDYLTAFLPQGRNAPVQTLINFHFQDRDLHAFRQFEAGGDKIYEQCTGNFFGKELFISLDENQLQQGIDSIEDKTVVEAYPSCFGDLVVNAGAYLDPLKASRYFVTKQVKNNTTASKTAVELAIEYFNGHNFGRAISILSQELRINPDNDEALFWRGMAYGRDQQHANGIADLGRYIIKYPDNSRAYTKRGVRYIWAGKLQLAKQDLQKAIALDAGNAEAHDDLGVIEAQFKNYSQAMHHFQTALGNDPGYQKAWHNMAMVNYVSGQHSQALQHVEKSLSLKPNRDSMLLKSLILESQGHLELAAQVRNSSNQFPENNWSESFSIR